MTARYHCSAVFIGEVLILTILFAKVMFPKAVRHAGRVENMDEYLQSLGLWRKVIPKDGASLYRVVAEQVRGDERNVASRKD